VANAWQSVQAVTHLHLKKIFIPNAATLTALTVFLTLIYGISPVLLPVIPDHTFPKPTKRKASIVFSKVFSLGNVTGNF